MPRRLEARAPLSALTLALIATVTGGSIPLPTAPDVTAIHGDIVGVGVGTLVFVVLIGCRRGRAALWLACLVAGSVWFRGSQELPEPPLPTQIGVVAGSVVDCGWGRTGGWATLNTPRGPLRLLGIEGDPPPPGATVTAFGSPRPPLRNPGRSPHSGSSMYVTGRRALFVSTKDASMSAGVYRLRRAIRHRVTRHFGRSTGGLAAALIIGDRSLVSESLTDRYRALGLSHLLAISGLHVGIVCAALYAGVRVVIPSATRWPWVLGMTVGGFAVLAGGSASVTRAALMAVTALAFARLGRRVDPLHGLAVAGWVTVLLAPSSLLSLGGSLSYAATAGILLYLRFGPQAQGRWGTIVGALAISVAAGLATAPIIAGAFGAVPLGGIVLSVPGGLAVAAVLVPLVLALLTWPLSPVSALCLDAAWPGLRALELLAHPGIPSPNVTLPESAWFAVFGAVGTVSCLVHRRVSLGLAVGVGATAWIVLSAPPAIRDPELIALDVGSAESLLLRIPTGPDIVIDAGRDTHGSTIIAALRALDVRPQQLVITHPHADHDGGLAAIRAEFPSTPVWVGLPDTSRVRSRAAYRTARLAGISRGDTLWVGRGGDLVCLHPSVDDSLLATNERSVVLGFRWGQSRVLLTGDLEGEGLRRWRAREARAGGEWVTDIDVLKVAHHGSPPASPDDFIRGVKPRVAVVSTGRVLDASLASDLDAAGSEVWSTHTWGAVRVRIAADGVRVSRWRTRWRTPPTPAPPVQIASPNRRWWAMLGTRLRREIEA